MFRQLGGISSQSIFAYASSSNETKRIIIVNRRWDPVSGTASALVGTTNDMTRAAIDVVRKPVQAYKQQRRALPPAERCPTQPSQPAAFTQA